MKLENKHPHMRGAKVLVNGTRYDIDKDGVVDIPKDDDAKKLLKGSAWKVYRGPLKAKKPAAEPKEPAPATEPEPPPPDEPSEAPDEPEEGSETDEGAEVEGEEWPEPDEDMDPDYLREMADAYDVKYTARSKNSTLVKNIREARGLD